MNMHKFLYFCVFFILNFKKRIIYKNHTKNVFYSKKEIFYAIAPSYKGEQKLTYER